MTVTKSLLLAALVAATTTPVRSQVTVPLPMTPCIEVPVTTRIVFEGKPPLVNGSIIPRVVGGQYGFLVKTPDSTTAKIQLSIDGAVVSCRTALESFDWGKWDGPQNFFRLPQGRHTIIASTGGTTETLEVIIIDGGEPVPPPEPEFCKTAPATLVVRAWPVIKNATSTSPNFIFTSPAPRASITFYESPSRAYAVDTRGCGVEVRK